MIDAIQPTKRPEDEKIQKSCRDGNMRRRVNDHPSDISFVQAMPSSSHLNHIPPLLLASPKGLAPCPLSSPSLGLINLGLSLPLSLSASSASSLLRQFAKLSLRSALGSTFVGVRSKSN